MTEGKNIQQQSERDAYIAFNTLDGIGPIRLRALVEQLGSAAAVFHASEDELRGASGIGRDLARKIVSFSRTWDPTQLLHACDSCGSTILTPVDEDYPRALAQIPDPPLALFVRGNFSREDQHAIAMVGSRRCSHYGTTTADRLAFQLVKQGYTVVSGLARGIDAAAHRGALKGGGRTIGVLGCGIDLMYPAEHAELGMDILRSGAIVSEFPPGYKPTRQSFPQRNRIISGLSQGTLVVEASVGSGALQTVDAANEQGRLVFAVPGRIDHPAAAGSNRLIKQGAKLVEDVDDIVDEFEYLLPPRPEGREDPTHCRPEVQLSADERAVLQVLNVHGALPVDDLIRKSGVQAAQVSTALVLLEMKRQITTLPGRIVRPAP